jgi:hypothetical protein
VSDCDGLVLLGWRLGYGIGHGFGRWLPGFLKRAICVVWNRAFCLLWGHDRLLCQLSGDPRCCWCLARLRRTEAERAAAERDAVE